MQFCASSHSWPPFAGSWCLCQLLRSFGMNSCRSPHFAWRFWEEGGCRRGRTPFSHSGSPPLPSRTAPDCALPFSLTRQLAPVCFVAATACLGLAVTLLLHFHYAVCPRWRCTCTHMWPWFCGLRDTHMPLGRCVGWQVAFRAAPFFHCNARRGSWQLFLGLVSLHQANLFVRLFFGFVVPPLGSCLGPATAPAQQPNFVRSVYASALSSSEVCLARLGSASQPCLPL